VITHFEEKAVNPFYALITPVEQPSQPPVPTHPIYYPPEISGPPGPWPSPPIAGIPGLPGYQPPSQPPGGGQPPGVPTHPIYYPPGIWGGGNQPFPTPPISGIPGLPGYQPPSQPPGGGQPPGTPTHPIYYPPGIWGGSNEPFPTPPISGIPGLPGYQPPGGGEPGPQPLPAVLASEIPQQPEAPDPDRGAWVLVGLGAGQVGWAWLDQSECEASTPDGESPEAPATP
jgi:hypothetical protein